MGQKVHPIGFRIGITKKHQVQWFAPFRKYKYSQTVLEDCMIRDTLTNLFPLLLNPTEQKKKRDDGNVNQEIPRISMIRIERGLIPYEIGIQVHAENCEILKASINNLKGKQELTSTVEKSRSFLTALKSTIESQYDISETERSVSQNVKSRTKGGTKNDDSATFSSGSFGAKKYAAKNKIRIKKIAPSLLYSKIRAKKMYTQSFESNNIQSLVLKNIFKTKKKILEYYARLSQKALNDILETKNTRTRKGPKSFGPSSGTRKLSSFKSANSFLFEKGRIERRLRERLKIRKRAVARLFQGVVFIKKGNIIQRQYLKPQMSKNPNLLKKSEMNYESQQKNSGTASKTSIILNSNLTGTQKGSTKSSVRKKKFLSILSIKFDNNFLKILKKLLIKRSTTLAKHREKQLQTYGFLKYAPLGFNRFWSLNNINKFKQKPKSTVLKLIRLIEQKAFAYLVSLRKDYKRNGGLSFSKVFAYYQIIRFLKKLKQFGRNLTESTSSNKSVPIRDLLTFQGFSPSVGETLSRRQSKIRRDFINSRENNQKKNTAIETTLKTKLQNIENECKKTKFITYLQQLVQKHRVELAQKLVAQDPTLYMPFQYGNPANPLAHYETTGVEILNDLPEVDVLVAGLGTGGTLMGVGRRLKECNPKTKVIAVEPNPGDLVQGLRSLDEGFIPPILDTSLLDGKIMVDSRCAFAATKDLTNKEGIFAGVSSGAVVHVAIRTAHRMEKGNIVVILCDGGWKYVSLGVWHKEFPALGENMYSHLWW